MTLVSGVICAEAVSLESTLEKWALGVISGRNQSRKRLVLEQKRPHVKLSKTKAKPSKELPRLLRCSALHPFSRKANIILYVVVLSQYIWST